MTSNTVATTILEQLGGRRFVAFTGAKHFVGAPDSLMFAIGGGAKDGINKVRITLTPADDYTVEYFRIRKLTVVEVARVEGLYCDQLQESFTRHTGFATHF